jgi:hypothetical protein
LWETFYRIFVRLLEKDNGLTEALKNLQKSSALKSEESTKSLDREIELEILRNGHSVKPKPSSPSPKKDPEPDYHHLTSESLKSLFIPLCELAGLKELGGYQERILLKLAEPCVVKGDKSREIRILELTDKCNLYGFRLRRDGRLMTLVDFTALLKKQHPFLFEGEEAAVPDKKS